MACNQVVRGLVTEWRAYDRVRNADLHCTALYMYMYSTHAFASLESRTTKQFIMVV
jgi:hypothetical protein